MSSDRFVQFRRQFSARKMPPRARRLLSDFLHKLGSTIAGAKELEQAYKLACAQPVGSFENITKRMRSGSAADPAYWVYYYYLQITQPTLTTLDELSRLLGRESGGASVDGKLAPSKATPDLTVFFSKRRSLNDLHYTRRAVKVVGRAHEQETLRNFLTVEQGDHGRMLRWLQLAGVAGQGKSRLAFDLVSEAVSTTEWDAGFLADDGLMAFQTSWRIWQPSKPTLIVIDYVIGREKLIAPAFRALVERTDLTLPVRLLFIERQRWDVGALERVTRDGHTQFRPSQSKTSHWFGDICGAGATDDADIRETRFEEGVVELQSLGPESRISLTREIATTRNYEISSSDDELGETLAHIDPQGRPLFAYLLAHRLADGHDSADLTREKLLTMTLEREHQARWKKSLGPKCPSLNSRVSTMQLARLATMVGGLDLASKVQELTAYGLGFDAQSVDHAQVILGASRGSGVVLSQYLPPMEPDLLGEWFVLLGLATELDCRL